MTDDATSKPKKPPARGLAKGLTSYGDTGFSLFLRKAFIKGAGYTDDALSRYRAADHDTPLLQKPFTPRTLAKKVRDVLAGVAV